MIYKECRACGDVKFALDFSPETSTKCGLKSYCKDCMAAKQRARRLQPEARERDAAYQAAYRATHPEWTKAQNTSPEKLASNARWSAENKLKRLFTQHGQLAKRAGVANEFFIPDWENLLEEFGCCAYCHARDVPLQIEHLTPLRRGGRHHRDNIVPACRSCNKRKDSRTMLEYFGLQTQQERKAEARRVRALARAA